MLFVALALALASSDPGGAGQLLTAEGPLVLTHTDVHARVMADVAVVDVTQTFLNPFDHPVDATYVFPLPVDAGVRDLTVTCGDRVVGSEILPREEAERRYEEARKEGRRAALLEQQADNVFTQKVSGLCPGEQVSVTLQYVDDIEVDRGEHRFVFPTTLGPRYAPGELQLPPLVAAPRPGRSLSMRVEVNAGVPLQSVWSDTYPIVVVGEDAYGAEVELLEMDALPNRDLHVSWTEEGGEPQALARVSEVDGERYLSLSVHPPDAQHLDEARARELVFVLDSSCSMQGEPWETAVATVEMALDGMRQGDRFNLVRFSDAAGAAFPRPVAATEEHVAMARRWMKGFEGGGTEMSAGILEALDQPGDPEALRMVLLLTDGYIGDERHLFEMVQEHLGDNDRIFALGVGSSTNHLLLDGLAHHGRGVASYQLPDTPMDETVRRFYGRIDHPALTDLVVDWGDLRVEGRQLESPPDVFAGQTLHLVGKVEAGDFGMVTIRGRRGGAPWEAVVPVDLAEVVEHEAVSTLWARREIQAVVRDLDRTTKEQDRTIAELAMAHRLVSRATSLVAVDEEGDACGASETVQVPQLLPYGMGRLGGGVGGLGGRGSGYGSGGGMFGAKGALGNTSPGTPTVAGSLDRSLIQEVVRRHMNQLRYCYTRELTRSPDLAGKLVMDVVVGADGTVSSAKVDSSTLGHEAVERCIVGRFLRMSFPAPKGSGVVKLRYPLSFSPE